METTGRFDLPLIMPNQAQKHITHNEALTLIDGLCHLVIKSFGQTTPPVDALIDEAYVIGANATGLWFDEDNNIALNTDTGWRFIAPRQGIIALDSGSSKLVLFDQGAWQPLGNAVDLSTSFLLGINTTADTTNRLALRSNAALLTALHVGDGGNGDMQLKINKETAGDTASLLYQTGFSGRAELGLAGDDAFRLKVSADGSSWTDALLINNSTGATTLADNSIGNAALADMPSARFKARSSAGAGDPQDITGTEATALLDVFSTSLKGVAPASGGGTTNFLRADGTWATPAGGGVGASWGGITGSLSGQADLQAALNAKAAIAHNHGTVDISDFAESVDDRVAALLLAGKNVALTYNDAANTLTVDNVYIEPGPARFYAFSDCQVAVNSSDWTFTVSGTGAIHSAVDFTDPNSLGALQSALGTTAAGRTSIASPSFATLQLGQGVSKFATRIRLAALSDATNTWTLRVGFIDSITAESTDAVYFRYSHGVNAGKFQAVTRTNNVETAIDTGITASISTTYKLELEVNALGTSVIFKINGAIVATSASNIPTANGREVGYGLSASKSVGTTAVNSYIVDYILADVVFTNER